MTLIQKIIQLSVSVPGYDDHGIHEFNGAGKLQNFLSWMFLIFIFFALFSTVLQWQTVLIIIASLSILVMLFLILITPIIIKYIHWEYKRWLLGYVFKFIFLAIIILIYTYFKF